MDLSDIDKFRDPIWRISNLYSIRTRDGKVIPFRPRRRQEQVLEMIFSQGFKRIVILKVMKAGNIHYELAEKSQGGQLRRHRRDPSDGQQTGAAARDRLPAASA